MYLITGTGEVCNGILILYVTAVNILTVCCMMRRSSSVGCGRLKDESPDREGTRTDPENPSSGKTGPLTQNQDKRIRKTRKQHNERIGFLVSSKILRDFVMTAILSRYAYQALHRRSPHFLIFAAGALLFIHGIAQNTGRFIDLIREIARDTRNLGIMLRNDPNS